jgi:succinate-semialdehyde dehydrogenase/glutarate-semialdehyde dehydrogenase
MTSTNTEPSSGRVLEEKLRQARAAHAAWSALGVRIRARLLRDFATRVREDQETVRAIRHETGKPEFEAFGFEVLYICELTRILTGRAGRAMLSETRRGALIFPHKRARITWQPRGVVAVIGPSNFPLLNNYGDAIGPLLAGNCVLLKPSPKTPGTARRIEQLWRDAGLPEGAFQVVEGGADVAVALVEACDGVFFTGSVAAGKEIAAQAGRRLIPCVTELGGKSAMIVLADADLPAAARAAVWGAFAGAGQVCLRVERVLVEDSVAEAFSAMVRDEASRLRLGVTEADVGPVAHASDVERCQALIEDAVSRGARLLIGGEVRSEASGRLLAPAVLDRVVPEAKVAREETFGPVLPIMPVANADEAVRLANESHLGLSGSVWSGDRARALSLARRMQAGSLCINDVLVNYFFAGAPFGGTKLSGLGFRHGPESLRQFCVPKTILEDRALLEPLAAWVRKQLGFPYRRGVFRVLRWLAKAIYR